MYPVKWYQDRRVWWCAGAFVLVMLIALVAECGEVKTSNALSAWTRAFRFGGQRDISEVATRDADITYSVWHKLGTTWTRVQPVSTSPDSMFTVFAGMSDRWSIPTGPFGTAAESTMVRVIPESATDVTVRVN